jgi:hypothetical protein
VALVKNAQLTHPSRWKLDIGSLDINTTCLAKLPEKEPSPVPTTLAEWQSMLPKTWVNIDRLRLALAKVARKNLAGVIQRESGSPL